MEVTLVLFMPGSQPGRYAINIFQDLPQWQADATSFQDLHHCDAIEVLLRLGLQETEARSMLSNIAGPLVLKKARLRLQPNHIDFLLGNSQLVAA